MEPPHHLTFGPFCLDVTHGCLWRGEQPIALRPRSLAVLQYGQASCPSGDEGRAATTGVESVKNLALRRFW